ncbi:DUF2231 domain-containing protein [Phytohabitans suffuscus]|uniref:DUF2231 domain-containing protein n=1 Tax=Phytohabitans suffuscus TaxID=624315 RepID=A0A6F8YH11_9ACTN|nr:DUF2231 domain-containing protein [Phytohabitans suffuscus]BCB85370.1 hypothetical protein Psuf_026830 [Phytohabitans suffuscus]
MFDEIMGLPMHPLVVHAAVVFIPLLAVAGVVYTLVPRVRARIGWAAALLALAGPAGAYVARESGQELKARLEAANYSQEILDKVSDHQGYGDLTFWFSLGLGGGTLLLVLLTNGLTSGRGTVGGLPSWLTWVLGAAVIVLAGVTGYYVFLTGDSGADAVWSGI